MTLLLSVRQVGGVSVVLNSLTSSGMVAGSLAALGPGGRFVEISKRDIWSAARVAQGKRVLRLTTALESRLPVILWVAGCFCESFDVRPSALAAERPDVGYSLVAVDFLPPPAVNATLSRLAADLASGALRPLPHVVHDLAAVRAALRQMSQARHVGKIVVRARTLQQQQGVDKVGVWLPPRAFRSQMTTT